MKKTIKTPPQHTPTLEFGKMTYQQLKTSHEALLKALKESEKRIIELSGMVNRFAIKLGLGNKVHAEDWSDVASNAISQAEGGV